MNNTIENKRQYTRKKANQHISVLNVLNGEALGTVVNLHSEGFMILGSSDIRADSVYQVEFVFEKKIDGRNHISLGAQCLWSRDADIAEQSWLGFHIIDSYPEDQLTIEKLIQEIAE